MNLPKYVQKGWGSELWIHNDEKYCGKLLCFDKGMRLSLHYHKLKHETFYVETGKLIVVSYMLNDMSTYKLEILESGDTKEVPPMMVHQMLALEETRMFEFSTQHFDDDSYRIVKGD